MGDQNNAAAIRAKWEAVGVTFGPDGRPRLGWPLEWHHNARGWAVAGNVGPLAIRAMGRTIQTHGAAKAADVLACIADAELAGVSDE